MFHWPPLPVPSAAAVERALLLLGKHFGPSKLLSSQESCAVYARDESEAEGHPPHAVVLASSEDDIARALEAAQAAGVPITPRSGGTGRVGGAVPMAGGIVLSTLGMNQVKHIDKREQLAVVEPGLILSELHHAVELESLFYPPDPNSLSACTIGGNVATNAGGPRAFKYGVTRNYVLGLNVALMGGQRFFTGRRTTKGVTGYDVTSLLVGSEGTLALFGDITLRLIAKPERVMTLMALFTDVKHSGKCVAEIIAQGLVPRCIELLDAGTLNAVRAAGNPIDPRANAMLLMEVDGTEDAVEASMQRVYGVCQDVRALDVLVAQDESQRARLWAARRDMSGAIRRMAKHKLSEDVVVPRQQVAELLERVERNGQKHALQLLTYGHAGDGNLHVNFLWNDEAEVPRVKQAIELLFRDVLALGGTLSGEHGIGVMKAPYLHLEQSAELITLQQQLKDVFDPKRLLNPGKILPTPGSHGAC
jgi:glycolate oxidase